MNEELEMMIDYLGHTGTGHNGLIVILESLRPGLALLLDRCVYAPLKAQSLRSSTVPLPAATLNDSPVFI